MKKTKLTLFVTVHAAALFMGGCASSNIPAPEGGVDLVGSGMTRAKGEVVRVSIEKVARGSARGSVNIPRQRGKSGSASFSGTSEISANIEVLDGGKGKTTELKISKIEQEEKLKSSMSGSIFTGAGTPDGVRKGPLHGKEYTLKKSESGSWGHPFDSFRGFLGNPELFPKEKVSVGHEWYHSDFVSRVVRAMPESRPGGATMPSLNVKVAFKYIKYTEFKGEKCAVIEIDIPRTQQTVQGARITVAGSGIIYRSLDSYRNLKGQVKVAISANQSQRQRTPVGTASLSMNLSASYEINEKEEVISKPEPPQVP
jgi:hypothetical protein